MEFNQLTKELFPGAESALDNFHTSRIDFISRNLTELSDLQKKLVSATGKGKKKINTPEQDRTAITAHFVDLKQWIGATLNRLSDLCGEEPWAAWSAEVDKIIAGLEDTIDLPYSENIILPDVSQSKVKRIARKLQGMQFNRRLKKYNKEIGKSPGMKSGRIFSLHHFIRYYLELPLAAHFYDQWQKYLYFFSNLLFRLHSGSEQLKDDILCSNMLSPDKNYWDLLGDHKTINDLNAYFLVFKELEQEVEFFKAEIRASSASFLKNMAVNLDSLWTIAGSPYCPVRNFSEKKIKRKQKMLVRKKDGNHPKWESHLKATCEEWLKDLELSDTQLHGIRLFNETLGSVKQKLDGKILPVFTDIEEDVSATLRKIETGRTVSDETLKSHIMIENRALVKNLRHKKLPQLLDTITQANFQQTVRGYFNRLETLLSAMRDEYFIFKERDLKQLPPDSAYVEVRLKDLIQDEIFQSGEKEFKILLEKFSKDMEAVLRGVSSLDQIVEFNLEAAYNLLMEQSDKQAIDEARKIAVEGLERTLGNLDELQNNLVKFINKTTEKFSAIVQDIEFDIQKLGDNEKIFELKLRLARAKTREKYREIRRQIWVRIKIIFPTLVKRFNQTVEKIQSGIFRIQKVTRLGPQETESTDGITRFLISTHQKINKMPYVYQRLFRLAPLEEKRFFYGRSDQIEQLQTYYGQYKNGFSASCAIVGEKGNGKTTMLNFAEKEIFKNVPVIKIDCIKNITTEAELIHLLNEGFNFPAVQTLDEFEARLQNDEQRRICYLENIHNLFMRTIDGFELIERFLLLISTTHAPVFWLVTCGLYGWEYLDKVVKISDSFKKVIYLKHLDRTDVMEIILKRHQVSGYGLWFEESDKALRTRQYKKLITDEDKQAYLKELFFDDLLDESGGNIKSAILFWLSAIKKFDEEKIDIAEEIGVDYSIIFRLTSDELFTLAALIQQEYLTHDQHARIFNQELNSSRSILGRLYKKGFLDRVDGKYSVHPFMYLPVVKSLKTKNILN